ncbi:hypothetical protein GCM10018980_54320 [Streptomyces capoamus]|uniref:Uncharacterized protein n=1 Tax=Streptomyces capoamus TaxID=68183 RepID=A0A919EZZ2_9ACTN|nr:hypothetical protein GCM10018980_54320 [Streptomyces capoamus]
MDHREKGGAEQCRAEPLERTGGDAHGRALGEAAEEARESEYDQARDEDTTGTEAVDDATAEEQ